MKILFEWLFLAGLIYAGYYFYENGYFDSVIESFQDTKENVSNFVTDKAINEAEFN